MTTLTNSAIILAAKQQTVSCGECRMVAYPERVMGIVERKRPELSSGEDFMVWTTRAVVGYRCTTEGCGTLIPCEVGL